MNRYLGVICSELGSSANYFIVEQIFHNNKDELIKYCEGAVQSISEYPALANYYIYKLEEGV